MKLIKMALISGVVAVSACALWWTQTQREDNSAPNGIVQNEQGKTKRTSFYLKTDEGFDKVQPVPFPIPFILKQAQWESLGSRSELTIQFDAAPKSVAKEAGFCVEIVANEGQIIVWWGQQIRPRSFPDTRPTDALVVRLSDNSIIARGSGTLEGDQLKLTMPLESIRVDSVYLYHTPSQKAKQEGGVELVSALHANPAPAHGRRVQKLQGGYVWASEKSE